MGASRTRAIWLALLLAALSMFAPASAKAANLVVNPGFETNCAGVPCNWTAAGTDTLTRDTSIFLSGAASLRVHTTTNLNGGAVNLACIVVAAGVYDASFWYRTTTSLVNNASFNMRYFSNSTCDFAFFVNGPSISTVPTPDSQWHQVAGTFTIPQAGSVLISLFTYCFQSFPDTGCPAAGADINFDDVFFGPQVAMAVSFASLSAEPAKAGVRVRWRTAAETSTLGYNVYREVNGKRVKANRFMITAHNQVGGRTYSFVDRMAPRGKLLRYWIQIVNVDGSRRWYGPTRVSAKRS